ncbi:MAG: ATP-dependent sacrificial sulfur transferase LarE [Acidobacteriota bacterium]|nr:ATP-dependent sacrificial sulfur transferase LarE [Acidobacteriota bacterium]OQB57744.1 MAG: tRNA(Ile)-lysidine synthase [Candidatus Aminicenantes bacterium ADurb.Bin147]HNT30989.1 ATP-dependent sacrificial sulfur transferase LarE [Candidatus Aminicenantes bacterium]MDD8037898.1 ATP-dependent sacrificial sulfur transferase LarE [Acidobacteriota bacterium]HOF84060.1 ATP-dependent sacrificial sulfur transferase LarE [Candidatus Aminicenantes bacterium]
MSVAEHPSVSRRLEEKVGRLRDILQGMDRVLVAFSGGTDSAFLLKIAAEVLDRNVSAVIASSPVFPASEIADAERLARKFKVRYRIIRPAVFKNPRFVKNTPLRCYECKKDLWRSARRIAVREGNAQIVDGQNVDDKSDYRPGAAAGREMGVRSPLQEAGLRKDEIRAYSRKLGLPNWDKPAQACLATRIPFGVPIRRPALARVAAAEEDLRRLGFGRVRVRDHGPVARIELDLDEIGRAMGEEMRRRINSRLKKRGYAFIALDLGGYRVGSLNQGAKKVLKEKKKDPSGLKTARAFK